ncbi:hypothetical protein PM082_020017 [Marasmius tenuissimus]|nr:hypothetical protein PM082_020017 [Marasmius tenuissimus]
MTKTDLQNRMSPQTFEACMILKSGFKDQETIDFTALNFTSHFEAKAMEKELEALVERDNELPLKLVSAVEYTSTFDSLQPCPLERTSKEQEQED